MEDKQPKKRLSHYIQFLGGTDLLFTLLVLIAFGIVINLFYQLNFIFAPIQALGGSILMPLVVAFAFYHLLRPIVLFLERFRIPHSIAVSVVFLVTFSFIIWLFVIIIPIIYDQIFNFISIFPSLVSAVVTNLQRNTFDSQFQEYYNIALNWLNDNLRTFSEQFLLSLGNTFNGLAGVLSTLSNVMISILTFPVMLFFLLLDGPKFKQMALFLFPPRRRSEISQLTTAINTQVGAYIQGKLIAGIVIGIILYTGFSVISLRYALALAILAAFASLIPYLGSIISLVPLLIVAASDSPLRIIQTLIVWAIVQVLDGNVLSPSIVGKNLKIHPLTIIIVLMVAGNMMGIFGMIIGIPLYAILRELFNYAFTLFRKRYNSFYGQDYGSYDLSETTEEPENAHSFWQQIKDSWKK